MARAREHHLTRAQLYRAPGRGVEAMRRPAGLPRLEGVDEEAGAQAPGRDCAGELRGEPSVSFGPAQVALVLLFSRLARAEIPDAGPRRGVGRGRPEVVEAGVLDQPLEPGG